MKLSKQALICSDVVDRAMTHEVGAELLEVRRSGQAGEARARVRRAEIAASSTRSRAELDPKAEGRRLPLARFCHNFRLFSRPFLNDEKSVVLYDADDGLWPEPSCAK